MRFHYSQHADALSIRLNNKRYCESDEVSEGVILDYYKSHNIIGIEILDASKKIPYPFRSKLKRQDVALMFAK